MKNSYSSNSDPTYSVNQIELVYNDDKNNLFIIIHVVLTHQDHSAIAYHYYVAIREASQSFRFS